MIAALRTDTAEAGFPWALPSVPTRHLTFHAKLRRARNRFAASAFARDIARGYRRSAAILGCVAATYACIVVTRGLFVVAAAFGVAQP